MTARVVRTRVFGYAVALACTPLAVVAIVVAAHGDATGALRTSLAAAVAAGAAFAVLGAAWLARVVAKPLAAAVADAERSRATVARASELTAKFDDAWFQVAHTGDQVCSGAEATSREARHVATAWDQVGRSVQTVATGTEEMTVTIREIAKNAAEAARVATTAVTSVHRTNELVARLGESSRDIGKVLRIITSIAEQTNLLALNATIEAARAGAAGKGFAVVANEVKELAKETARATEDIGRKIGAIQADTGDAVASIGQITMVIAHINEIQGAIASAVDQQAATTNEIGRSLHELAQASTAIVGSVGSVSAAAKSTADYADQTRTGAVMLAKISHEIGGVLGARQPAGDRTSKAARSPSIPMPTLGQAR